MPAARAFALTPADTARDYRLLVLLVEFSDVRADRERDSPAAVYQRVFGEGTTLADYYAASSGGRLRVGGRVSPWIQVGHSYAYYANEGTDNDGGGIDPFAYPHNVQRLVEDAVAQVRSLYHWGEFDNNGDGRVDGLLVIHAGPSSAEGEALQSERILAHQFHVSEEIPVPGGLVFDYAAAGETASPGVIAHEFGHLLGLVDLYDAGVFSGIDGPFGVGDWSLMGTGALLDGGRTPCLLDAWSRARLGFVTPQIVTGNEPSHLFGTASLHPDQVLRLRGLPGTGEYLLAEARLKTGYDRFLPGEGLLIYPVDESVQTNTSSARYHVAVVQADGRNDLGRQDGNRGDGGDPFPGSANQIAVDAETTPALRANSGEPAGVGLSDIRLAAAGTGVIADVLVDRGESRPRLVRLAAREVGGDGVIRAGDSLAVDAALVNDGGPGEGAMNLYLDSEDPLLSRTSTHSMLAMPAAGETLFVSDAGGARVIPGAPLFTAPRLVSFRWFATFRSASGPPGTALDSVKTFVGPAGFSDDFDPPADGWTHASLITGRTDPWHLSNAGEGGAPAYLCGNESGTPYAPGLDAVLVSPLVAVGEGFRLGLTGAVSAESLATGRAWDGGLVEIAPSGGDWVPLLPEGGYPFRLETGSGNPAFGRGAFSGERPDFGVTVFDLGPWAGTAVRLRFRFATDLFTEDAARQPQRGWFVGGVALRSDSTRVAVSAAAGSGGTVNVQWTVTGPAAAVTAWLVGRRPDVSGSLPVPLFQRAAEAGRTEYAAEDSPPPGRWIYTVRALESGGAARLSESAPVRVGVSGRAVVLGTPFPVPFNPAGTPLTLPLLVPDALAGRDFQLEVIDVAGRLVATVAGGKLPGGALERVWNGRGSRGTIRSGLYWVRLSMAGEPDQVRRLVVAR